MTDSQRKNAIYSVLLILAMVLVWWLRDSGSSQPDWEKVSISGTTMGTTYSVKYLMTEPEDYQQSIDSLLENFNQCLSTYITDSEISRFNQGALHRFQRPYFYEMLEQSKVIHQRTSGAFDPTVMPLVEAWGFGPQTAEIPSPGRVDSILTAVGFEHIFYDQYAVCKENENTKLDFSAIAKGYAVDLVMRYLQQKGLENIFVEIGGEISAIGVNELNKPWAIYIEKPEEQGRDIQALVTLDNIAVATSGNYRNFYIKDGKKYAHTISPYTGYPVQHSLLSVSVFAKSCAQADAYATAFMVLGLEKALQITQADQDLEAYFIFDGEDGALSSQATSGLLDSITE
jgi:thiamine biosynthesis lipoprotein